jgi:putative transcriptional regulator
MYRWNDMGLKNVWLVNGYTLHETPYGQGVSFEDVEGLTRAVSLALARKPGKLTGAEFRYLRQAGLGLSQASLGKVLGADAQSIARWEKSGKVPKWANRMIRLVFEAHADGDAAIRRVVERINDIDRLVNRRIVLEQTVRRGWRARTEDREVEAVA